MPNLLITGGARGIGHATCILAASRGWSVAINYVSNEHAALDTARDVERHGSRALLLPGDVVDEHESWQWGKRGSNRIHFFYGGQTWFAA